MLCVKHNDERELCAHFKGTFYNEPHILKVQVKDCQVFDFQFLAKVHPCLRTENGDNWCSVK